MGACSKTFHRERHQAVRLTPERRMYVLGAALCAALIICSRDFGDRGGSNFFLSLTVAGVAYLLVLRELFKTPKFPRHVLVVGLVLSAVWHAAFLVVPAGPDDDIHR